MNVAPALREHVADLLTAVGPNAPTLCEGWNARDLAAHLVVRDRRVDAMPGIVVPALASHTAKVQNARAKDSYDNLVRDVRTGPGRFSLMQVPAINERANLAEYAIHAEDIRRAQPESEQSQLPPMPTGTDDAVWASLPMMGKLLVRKSPVGVTLRSPGRADVVLKDANGQGSVVITGQPVDVLLHLSGRCAASKATVEGPATATERFNKVKLGF